MGVTGLLLNMAVMFGRRDALSEKNKSAIISTNGVEGACTAGMVLLAYPDARIYITSSTGIQKLLSKLSSAAIQYQTIHICGVNIDRELPELLAALASLKKRKTTVYWYCGRGYLSSYEKELKKVCNTVLRSNQTNTRVLFDSLKLKKNRDTSRLLRLVEQPDKSPGKISEADRQWYGLIKHANQQYFLYQDTDSTPEAIRILAGLKSFTADHIKKIKGYLTQANDTWILGNSSISKKLREKIKRIARYNEPVLITGPSGIGKEGVARAIHEASHRPGALHPLNCSILNVSDALANDELFGHTKGAYTGAGSNRSGAFESAHNGSLFLDEVGELSLTMQTLFLRVLEEKLVYPLGSDTAHRVDVRIIAATNRSIPELIQSGQFREDLYYRLNVIPIHIPAIAERSKKNRRLDLEPIYKKIKYSLKVDKISLTLSEQDWEEITNYDWPGNIRQFQNILKRAAYMKKPVREILKEERETTLKALSDPDKEALQLFRPTDPAQIAPLKTIERSYARHVYKLMGQNLYKTAEVLGIAQNTLRNRLK